jgi:predicted ester cyclase
MSEANKEILKKIEAAWKSGRTDDLDQYFAPDFHAHSNVPGLGHGLEGAKQANGMVTQFLSDRKGEIIDLIAEGDKVLVRMRATGKAPNGVPWIGAGPSDKTYDFESWAIYTFKDGKVVETVGLNDVWLFAIQMDAVKPPMPPPPA